MATVAQALTLYDRMSPVLSSIIDSMDKTLSTMKTLQSITENGLNGQNLSGYGDAIDRANDALARQKNQIEEIPPAQAKVEKGFSAWQKAVIVVNQGIELAQKLLGTIGSAIGISDFSSAFARIDVMESFERAIQRITGSTLAGASALDILNTHLIGTPYGLDQAAKATQNYITRGMNLGEATEQVRIWGDAVAVYANGSREAFETVLDATAQMRTKGKVNMQQLNRLFNVGINPVADYAKIVGKTQGQVQDELSAGTISANEFLDTVTRAMDEGTNGVIKTAGAAKQAGASWEGTLANMRIAGTRGMIALVTEMDRAMTSLGLGTLRENIARVGPVVERTLKQIGTGIGNFISTFSWLFTFLGAVLRGIGNGFRWVSENWNVLGPIMMSLIIVLGTAYVAWQSYNVAMMVAALWSKTVATVQLLKAAATGATVAPTVAATAAQWALNVATYMFPGTWIILAIMAVIAALIAIGLYLRKVWQTNIEFRVKVLTAWNSLLDFFDQVPIFFQIVGNGVTNAIGTMGIKILQTMDWIINGVIARINSLIAAVSSLPGISIQPISHISNLAAGAIADEANRIAKQEAELSQRRGDAVMRSAERAANLAQQEWMWRQEAARAGAAQDLLSLEDLMSDIGGGFDEFGGGDGGKVTGGKLDKVDEVGFSDEVLKFLKDLAYVDYINRYTTLRPVVNVAFGDVRETADVDQVIRILEDAVKGAYDSSMDRG